MSEIELKRLEPDPRNANHCQSDTLAKIERHIQRTGLCPPLIIRPHPRKKNKFIVMDGHHRLKILKNLGWSKVECQIWPVDETEATLALATLNRLRGTDNPVKRAELIDELCQRFSLPDLAELLPDTQAEMTDLLTLLELDMEQMDKTIQEQIEKEKVLLPVSFGCLLSAEEYAVVEQALDRFKGSQAQKLVTMSQSILSKQEELCNG